MNLRNSRVLAFAVAMLVLPLFAAWSQSPRHQRPQQEAKPEQQPVTVKETPIEEGDPFEAEDRAQAQGTQPQTGTQPQPGAPAQNPAAPQGQQGQQQGQAAPAAPPAAGTPVTPEQIGLTLTPPQGWQQVDATTFTVPGTVCCAWKPGELASIVVFVQAPGRPLIPRVLLDQSVAAFQAPPLSAQVQRQEVVTIGGKRGFSMIVTAAGNGAAITGSGDVQTTQHWVAIPREQDVIIFLMTTPAERFDQNEQAFMGMLNGLQVGGNQTPEQTASQ